MTHTPDPRSTLTTHLGIEKPVKGAFVDTWADVQNDNYDLIDAAVHALSTGGSILHGTTAPTTEGVAGDYYIRTTTNYIYGPKTTTWPAGVSLVGPAGATGATGPAGGGARPGTYVIACADSTSDETAGADVVLTGTGDAAAISAAFATMDAIASAHSEIHILSGTVTVEETIVGASGVSLIGHGTTFDASAYVGDLTVLEYAGSESNARSITVGAVLGEASVTASNTGFNVGDLVRVQSDRLWSADIAQMRGEYQFIGALGGGVITFTAGGFLRDSYMLADTPKVYKVTPMADFEVSGISFVGAVGYTDLAINIEKCINARVHHCRFTQFEDTAVQILDSYSCRVENIYVDKPNPGTYGYGVTVMGCSEGCTVADSTFYHCRHATATGSANGYGILRNITFQGNQSFDANSNSFDGHYVGEGIAFIGNQSSGGTGGISTSAASGSVVGNTVIMPNGTGITVKNIDCEQMLVSGNTVLNTVGNGIYIASPNTTAAGNVVVGAGMTGIYATTRAAYDELATGCRIVNNDVQNSSRAEAGYANIKVAAANCVVHGNTAIADYWSFPFDGGDTAKPIIGETIHATGSGASGTLIGYTIAAGTFAGGDAEGVMIYTPVSGVFVDEETAHGNTSGATFELVWSPTLQTNAGILIDDTATAAIVTDNDVRTGGKYPIDDSGTATILRNNAGDSSDMGKIRITSPTNGQYLRYDSSLGAWKNSS